MPQADEPSGRARSWTFLAARTSGAIGTSPASQTAPTPGASRAPQVSQAPAKTGLVRAPGADGQGGDACGQRGDARVRTGFEAVRRAAGRGVRALAAKAPRSYGGAFRAPRSLALLTSGVLVLPVLAGCTSDDSAGTGKAAAQDIAAAEREAVGHGGSLRWAIEAVPTTLNTFQADADAGTSRIAGAVLPALFTLDRNGRPQRNPDYVESAKIVAREPKQVVLYKLNQKAVWSDGREIGAPDFAAQWRALSGRDTAYWTARNAGYERIEEIQKGANDLEVKVTFKKPYADWQSLFTPLYPKEVTGSPNAFNDGARKTLKATAGPFQLGAIDRKAGTATLERNPRWWGDQAKLDRLVLTAVPRGKRAAALAARKVDIAEIDRATVDRIALAKRDKGAGGQQPKKGPNGNPAPKPAQGAESAQGADTSIAQSAHLMTHGPAAAVTPASALLSWALAHGSDEEVAETAQAARAQTARAIEVYAVEQRGLPGYVVRKSLEPAFTQLALNGETGPLADDRVRRAVARALDRKELAKTVLGPLGLPATPPGSHLALAGQRAYTDNSGALGEQNTQEAQALLADAGWVPGGALKKPEPAKAGGEVGTTTSGDPAEAASSGTGEADDGKNTAGKRAADGKTKAGSTADGRSKNKSDGTAGKSADGKSTDGRNADGKDAGGRSTDGKNADGRNTAADAASNEGLYIVGDEKFSPLKSSGAGGTGGTHILAPAPVDFQDLSMQRRADGAAEAHQRKQGGKAGAYAPAGTAAPVAAGGRLGKDGKALSLRFVLPSGPGSEALRSVGDKISRMLDRIGIQTEVIKVADESYFRDHIASGNYHLALYSWPATAYPATDARPIYAKPEPASDGSLLVEQNYTRVGTDYIDQLFDQAAAELDENAARDLMRRADARIWAAAGSIPLYQRPELVAAKPSVRNAGAFGFAAPRYQDIGFTKGSVPKSGPVRSADTAKTARPDAAESAGTDSGAENAGSDSGAESAEGNESEAASDKNGRADKNVRTGKSAAAESSRAAEDGSGAEGEGGTERKSGTDGR
ncbi:ABC transporter family substrate-binding protein [Streptomyces albipurpureus]|uniref:ABC transporter family substrate-binding protein n=1 Tax=Streptomyces albipurpureus TaxID=2897419 RepID=A0ABT0UKG6_9ACTN|nr:ABC transporter family substrate-binding protein [Streptomyces sp. CWNU-1]MCM2389112.1 ABC transporter family substrate-binding protein [Streptomyces sp. CWNU-1]